MFRVKGSNYEEGKVYRGQVKFFNHKNKFGFIRIDEDGEEIYVHEKHINEEIRDDDRVQFMIESRKRGPVAVDVSLLEE